MTVAAGVASGEPGDCASSLQSEIDATPSGGTVFADACIYREAVRIDKPITLEGGGRAEIRGSEVWQLSRFSARADGTWVAAGYPSVGRSDTDCEPGTSRCRRPEQVYYDGQPLTQVDPSSTPEGMEFAVNANRDLIVGANPSGHLVEVTVRDGWVRGAQGANGVVIRGFIMQHAAEEGVSNGTQPNWTVEDSDLSWAHTVNLRLTQASGLVARNVHSHHGGQAGMWGTGSRGLQVLGGEYDHNNIEDFLATFSSGGVKVSAGEGTVFDGVEAHHNAGNGLWFDVPNPAQEASAPMTMSNNRVHHNERHGIKCEVTLHCRIFSNVVYENGSEQDGGGITANGSSFLRVHDNVVAWNRDGITIANPLRSDNHPDQAYYDKVRDVEVDNNKIFQEEGPGRLALSYDKRYTGGNIFDPAANVRGHDNLYYFLIAEGSGYRFAWDGNIKLLSAFNTTPGEERGRYMTEQEKNDVLAQGGIPLSPER